MITESIRERLYQELEDNHPMLRAGKGSGLRSHQSSAGALSDLSGQWHQAFFALKEQLLTQLLFQLHTLFEFPADDAAIQSTVREALESIYQTEEACKKNGPFDAQLYASSLLRNHWHGALTSNRPSLLTGVRHLEHAGFFQKMPQEIASWTKRFLLIERYHRLDARENENRLDRLRTIRARITSPGVAAALDFDDLLIWLEFRLLEQTLKHGKDIGALSNELSLELEKFVPPTFLKGDTLQSVIYILLKTHQFCLSETIEPAEKMRLEQLFATRQLDSVLDLMRVIVTKTLREHQLPEVGTILDQLQTEGFNIEHQGFRDPYEAQLVAPSESMRLEQAHLPLFLPLERLSGEFECDLPLSRQMLLDWHQRIINEVIGDCEAYAIALFQPLPKAHLIHKLVRFAASWNICRYQLFPSAVAENLEEDIRSFLPENVIRQLVRPRKGYEIKSRQELSDLISGEARRQMESLERIAYGRRVQGFNDYTQFTRYIAFQYLRERFGEETAGRQHQIKMVIENVVQPEWVAEAGKRWGIDTGHIHPHTLESILHYLRTTVAPEMIIPELEKHFETSENELHRIYKSVLDATIPAFYRLLVAYGRHRAGLSRSPATLEAVPQLVSLLASRLVAVNKTVYEQLKQGLGASGAGLYRSRQRPYLVNQAEWKAYLAWETQKCVGKDFAKFLDIGDLDGLLKQVEQAASNVDLPLDTLSYETARSTLLDLLKPSDAAAMIPETQIAEISNLLPQVDCAACGQRTCRDFAGSLLTGRTEPGQCVQLPSHRLPGLTEALKRLRDAADGPTRSVNTLDLLLDRALWRASPEREAFQNVLSGPLQKSRRLFLDRLKEIWNSLSPKPQIFKCPDSETLYTEFCRFMGYEATERLREEEKQHLIEHGDERQKAEWHLLKQRQDWLGLTNISRQSRPLLKAQDSAWLAGEAYRNIFFLHQLGLRDRQMVLRFRLDRHQDGFSHWWNEDLLNMNLPDFSIRDWEDFSKIIKNAYWHQENSLSAGEALSTLRSEALFERNWDRILDTLLDHWIDLESIGLMRRHEKLQSFRKDIERAPVRNVADLRDLVQGLVDELMVSDPASSPLSSFKVDPDDRQAMEQERLWKRFQSDGFVFSPTFSCLWEEMLPCEKKVLEGQSGIGTFSKDRGSSKPSTGGEPYFITSWGESLQKRSALIRTLILSCIDERSREEAELRWLKEGNRISRVPLGSLRLLIRELLRKGREREQIQVELRRVLDSKEDFRKGLLDDALTHIVLKHQYELLHRSGADSPKALASSQDDFKAFPELKSFLNILLERHRSMDRERLLHYLFLLAKMEGNLDTLTALLREIRETSDIIEAAWLRFTQERITEGPVPKGLPGTTLGIPLLVSRLKDREPVNRGLREGVSRREKRNVAMAVSELLNIIRYHILLHTDQNLPQSNVQAVLRDVRNAGYDLSGIEEDALRAAVKKEWERRGSLSSQKIWIYTTVSARRIAAQNAELQEAEREFHKIRLDILKDDTDNTDSYHEIANRRSVALGQVKEETYRQLSDLLEAERMATFQKRIRQIVDQLDQKRKEIHKGWVKGEINRRTIFYVLRRFQKSDQEPAWEDFEKFWRDHWLAPLSELRASERADREERIRNLDERFRAVLGTSLLELEAEARAAADQDIHTWMEQQIQSLEQ